MNKELVKNELVKRLNDKYPPRQGNIDTLSKLRAKAVRLKTTSTDLFHDISPTLNQILAEQNVELNEDEKTELLIYLRPYIIEIMQTEMLL